MKLNPQQLEAVRAPDAPLLIVAGAGTGKTRTLTSRIIHLIEHGVPPERICAVTFTNKAAREMADRVRTMTIDDDNDRGRTMTIDNDDDTDAVPNGHSHRHGGGTPFIGTFHSLGARILREECRRLNRTPRFVIFDDHDSFQLIKKTVKDLEFKKPYDKPVIYANAISKIKNGALAPDELERSSRREDTLALEAYRTYEERLEQMNAFDFDDLIEKVVVLFRSRDEVRDKYASRHRYLLVDEYQDVSVKQHEFIELLADDGQRLSVVGDDSQLIYGWRWAKLEIFLDFDRRWPGAQTITLEENYRSTGTILRAASAVIARNARQKPKTLWTRGPKGNPISIYEATDEEDEAEWIVRQIESGIKNYELGKAEDGKAIIHNSKFIIPSTAVLYRTNAQSRAIEQALLAREIPYRIFGGIKFYERLEIKDILAALRLVWNPKDAVSRERLERAFSRRTCSELAAALKRAPDPAPTALIKTFIEATDYLNRLERNFTNAAERQENVAELIRFASEFDDLGEFLERVTLLQATDAPQKGATMTVDNDHDATPHGHRYRHSHGEEVHLMTIHLAKGLEFDRVFVIGCTEGLLPHARSMDSADSLEEERRLMYVAMTRARKELALSFYDVPSRFLFEIPKELTRFESSDGEREALTEDEERYVTID